jgi:DNA topoisomerase-2
LLVPWCRGFTGRVVPTSLGRFKSTGVVSVEGLDGDAASAPAAAVITVTELPIGLWVVKFKQWLDTEVQRTVELATKAKAKAAKDAKDAKDASELCPAAGGGLIKSHSDTCTDTEVRFVVHLTASATKTLRAAPDVNAAALAMLQLERPILTTNMHAFDAAGAICKYDTPEDIVDAFMPHREALYRKRLAAMETTAAAKVQRLAAEARFVAEVVSGSLVVAGRGKAELLAALAAKQYPRMDGNGDGDSDGGGDTGTGGFQYLLRMPLWALTTEAVGKLEARKAAAEEELAVIRRTTALELWRRDLDAFEAVLDGQDAAPITASSVLVVPPKKALTKVPKRAPTGTKAPAAKKQAKAQ